MAINRFVEPFFLRRGSSLHRAATFAAINRCVPKLLLVTDAWAPQINGVVTTLEATIAALGRRGWIVRRISPEQFRTVPSGYPGIRLAIPPYQMRRLIMEEPFDAAHIATEGLLGLAARNALRSLGIRYTSAFHTNYPAYLQRIAHVPERVTFAAMRWFHGGADTVMVPTPHVANMIRRAGFERVALWGRGVDTMLFHPRPKAPLEDAEGPIWLNVGRVSFEKGLPAFLDLDLPGTKVVVGDGPLLGEFQSRYPSIRFLGALRGEALARAYAMADVFVFPSRTDTFGLVMAEAIATGIPVAAHPVTGPRDVVQHGRTGWLSDDLREACLRCLELDRDLVAEGGRAFSWDAATDQFVANLTPALTG